jgi:hypothetical protein
MARDEKSISPHAKALAATSSRFDQGRFKLLLCSHRRVLGFRAAFTGTAGEAAQTPSEFTVEALKKVVY